jgi:protein TonB
VGTVNDELPRFTIAIGAAPEAYGAASPTGSARSSEQQEAEDTPVPESLVDGKARLVFGLSPSYPESARAAGVEGNVQLELVVNTAGSVESARVLQGIDRGLDAAALQAAQRFRFAPATKSGRPVRVRMRWSVEFRLR